MRPSEAFAQHRDTIRRLVLESGMTNPRLFGSVLHGDDVDGSDLDILIDVPRGKDYFDMADLQDALQETLGVKVDVRTPGELHRAFRDVVVSEAMPL